MKALSSPAAATRGRVPELDGVRGLAILLVVVWHYVGFPLQAESGFLATVGARALRLTGSGVDLFFVLSGFLIGGILFDQRESPGYFKAFSSGASAASSPSTSPGWGSFT